MKITFAIKTMNNASGGAERVLSFLLNTLYQKGYDVSLLSFDGENATSFYPLEKNVQWLKLAIGNPSTKATFIETVSRVLALRKYVRTKNPDIVIAFMHSMFIPMAFSMIGSGVPLIGSEHIVPIHYKKKKLEFLLLCLSSFFQKSMTVLSDDVKKLYPTFIQKKMVSIPNPIQATSERANTVNEEAVQKIILNVGRLDPQKDQNILIESFAHIAKKHPEWHLRILGEGALKNSLKQKIQELGLGDRITLVGTTKDIHAEYIKAHIFAITSLYESFGMATAEAMSFGLPAIGFSDCPGTNELIISNYNGILVEGRSSITFANHLSKLIESPEQRKILAANGVHSVERFHPNKVIDMWVNVIEAGRDNQT